MRQSVRVSETPDSACVAEALREAALGTVSQSCDTSTDAGQPRDTWTIEDQGLEGTLILVVPRTPGAPSEVSLYWGRPHVRPTRQEVAKIRSKMTLVYAQLRKMCRGFSGSSEISEECRWCE
jgi:hypothetical protein